LYRSSSSDIVCGLGQTASRNWITALWLGSHEHVISHMCQIHILLLIASRIDKNHYFMDIWVAMEVFTIIHRAEEGLYPVPAASSVYFNLLYSILVRSRTQYCLSSVNRGQVHKQSDLSADWVQANKLQRLELEACTRTVLTLPYLACQDAIQTVRPDNTELNMVPNREGADCIPQTWLRAYLGWLRRKNQM
jgi:hypothetical protein